MKRIIVIFSLLVVLLSGCATILLGPVSECQRTKPLPGKPSREIRTGCLIVDIVFTPAWIIDIATGAIYKPCK